MFRRLSQKERRKIVEKHIGKVPWGKFTPGIYNYCDRWCEKCKKTKKCFLFWDLEKEKKEMIKKGVDPEGQGSMFASVKNSLSLTMDLIRDISKAEGIDLTISKKQEKEFELFDKKTDPKDEPLYKFSKIILKETFDWLESVPPLDFKDYKDEYQNLVWHHTMVSAKVARSLRSKLEAKYERGDMREFSKEDSGKSGWVADRSAKICRDALDYMDDWVKDERISALSEKYAKLIDGIDQELL